MEINRTKFSLDACRELDEKQNLKLIELHRREREREGESDGEEGEREGEKEREETHRETNGVLGHASEL